MIPNPSKVTKGKSVLVPSRYAKTTYSCESRKNVSVGETINQRNVPRASSPIHEISKCKDSFNIHDSVASIIHPGISSSNTCSTVVDDFKIRKSLSVPDITTCTLSEFDCTQGANKKRPLPLDANVLRERLRSNLQTWEILDKITQNACTKIIENEKAKQRASLAKLKGLEDAAAQRRQVYSWCEKWLDSQKSIDSQIEVLQKLESILHGDVSPGILQMLRRIHDDKLFPVSQKMEINNVQFSSFQDLLTAACSARTAGENFSRSIEGELNGIKTLAAQMKLLIGSLNSGSIAATKENILKLKEVEELFIHFLSLKVHKNQCQILKNHC